MLEGWFARCVAHANAHGLDVTSILRAFGHDEATDTGDLGGFAELDAQARARAGELPARIVDALVDVDRGQAELFARRYSGVHQILEAMPEPEAALFRVALVGRAYEILADPRPRALRIRALSDYYYSQAAVLRHRGRGRPLDELIQASEWRTVRPGLEHLRVEGLSDMGPVFLNALRLRGGRIESLDCRGRDFAERVQERGAAAGVSGGFFLYSEPDIEAPSQRGDPVGLLFDGELRPPVFRRASLLADASGYRIERVGPEDVVFSSGGWKGRVEAVNDPARLGQALVAFNRAHGRHVEWPHCVSLVGRQVVARSGDVPLAGLVLAFADALPEQLTPGAELDVEFARGPVFAAMAGGPFLLGEKALDLPSGDFAGSAPPLTFSADETFDQNLLPRMGAGLTEDGALVFLAVDGRNFERAPGFTLGMTGQALAKLGCVSAMNLDGGSSKRMVVDGEVVDLPSTEVVHGAADASKVRPVRSGILLFPG